MFHVTFGVGPPSTKHGNAAPLNSARLHPQHAGFGFTAERATHCQAGGRQIVPTTIVNRACNDVLAGEQGGMSMAAAISWQGRMEVGVVLSWILVAAPKR